MLIHSINHLSLEAAAQNYPNLTHCVVLDTVTPSTPAARYPNWKTAMVVTEANKSVEKLSFMVVAANPGDLEHKSAFAFLTMVNAQESEAFIASLTRRHDHASAHASSTADFPIPMNETVVLLPEGVVGSNTYFNEGDDDI